MRSVHTSFGDLQNSENPVSLGRLKQFAVSHQKLVRVGDAYNRAFSTNLGVLIIAHTCLAAMASLNAHVGRRRGG
jgi:hypothetical protein